MLQKLLRYLRSVLGLEPVHPRRRVPKPKRQRRIARRKPAHGRQRRAAKRKKQGAKRRLKQRTKTGTRRRLAPLRTASRSRAPVLLGTVTHYYPQAKAAVVILKKSLQVGVPVWINGRATDFRQTVGSIQVNRVPIEKGRPGQEIGLEVMREVRAGDRIFLSQ